MNNRLGLHANVWVAGWSHEEAARAIDKTAGFGFDFIEAPALDPSSIDVEFTRRQLESVGLGIALSLGLDAATDISSGEPDLTRAGERRLLDAISVARDLGATNVSGILYSAFQKYSTPPTADGVSRSVEVMRRVAETAAQSDIVLGIEVVNRYESNMINTAAQGVEYCSRVAMDNVKVHLDVYHMNIEETDVASAIDATGDALGYFHTGDSHRGYMGSGSVDLVGVFRALARIGYTGPIAYESFSSRVVGQPLTGILGIWRETWDDSDDLVGHAMTYTKGQLKAAEMAHKGLSRLA